MPERETVVESALRALSLEQKVRLLTGADFWHVHAEPAVGLASVLTSDGPAGVRGEHWEERHKSTSFPSPTALAATWDESLLWTVGAALAVEARSKDVHVVLGPTINIQRSPLGGRHFECFSEDPLLTGRLAVAYVRGLQEHGIAATPKHYVANDSETERFTVTVRVDERALREVYLAPFEQAVVEAGAWAVMAAYNAVNGPTMTENDLLADPLKKEWGFDGVVMSDWAATRTTEEAGNAALDLVMPGPTGPWGDALVEAVCAGRVAEAAVDDKVRRLLLLAARVGALRDVPVSWPVPDVSPAAVAREVAARSMVLLRNEDALLPLAPSTLAKVAVIGPNAELGRGQGGGSAEVHPYYQVSPIDGILAALPSAEVTLSRGARNVFGLVNLSALDDLTDPETGEPGLRMRRIGPDGELLRSERRESGRLFIHEMERGDTHEVEVKTVFRAPEDGRYRFGVAGVGKYTLTASGQSLVDEVIAPAEDGDIAEGILSLPERSGICELHAGEQVSLALRHVVDPASRVTSVKIGLEKPQPEPDAELAEAVARAAEADVAIVVVGTTDRSETEGLDRTGLALPGRQDELVRAVAAVNPRTVVVVNSGGPVLMPWRDEVAAILLTWFPGQEFGNALADVLFGAAEPGGRLPTTWPAAEQDVPVLDTQPVDGQLGYEESIHVGYRAWARAGNKPAYAFGSGLGYTDWALVDAEVPEAVDGEVVLTARLRNTGGRAGRTVVQAYLSRPDSDVERPALWLAGFAIVTADAGEEATASITLAPRAFQHWDDGWQLEPGTFRLALGFAADDIAAHYPLEVR